MVVIRGGSSGGSGGRSPVPPAASSFDPEKLRQEIRAGVRLRHVETVDKSKPFIEADGEVVRIKRTPVIPPSTSAPAGLAAQGQGPRPGPGPPPPPPPAPPQFRNGLAPPPPPPPGGVIHRSPSASSFTLPKASLKPGDRDRLLQEIKMGRPLRHVQTVDKSKPIVAAEVEDDSPYEGYNNHANSNGYSDPAYDEVYRPNEFAPIGETGFVPTYGRTQSIPPPPPPPPPQNGLGKSLSVSPQPKPKPHAGFYMDAEPPPPSTNPNVDESPFSVDNMINVFNDVLTKAEQEEAARRERNMPRGRVDTSLFDRPHSNTMPNPKSSLRNGSANGFDGRSERETYGMHQRKHSANGVRFETNARIMDSPDYRPESPPTFREESFTPDVFRSEELVANRYVSPVIATRISARDEIKAIEARNRALAAAVPSPTRASTLPPPRRIQPPPAFNRPPEDVYEDMAAQPARFTHNFPLNTNRNDFSTTPLRPYQGAQSPFVPEELIANRYVPSPRFANDYPLPELTPASRQVLSEATVGLHSNVAPPRDSRGQVDRTFAQAIIQRNDNDAHIQTGRTDILPPDAEELARVIKPGSSRALASQFEERSRSNSPAPNSGPPLARRSQSTHALLQNGHGNQDMVSNGGNQDMVSTGGRFSPVYASQRGQPQQLSPQGHFLPSVNNLKSTFERPPPGDSALRSRRLSENSGGWQPSEQTDTGHHGVPWQRLFKDQGSKFRPDVGRLADAFEERRVSGLRPPTPSSGIRRPSGGHFIGSGGESGSAEDSSSQGSSNGENRYPTAFFHDEAFLGRPPSPPLFRPPPPTSRPPPVLQPPKTTNGAVPWRQTSASPVLRTTHVGTGGFPEEMGVLRVEEDVFAMRDFHRAELESLRQTYEARLRRSFLT